MKPEELLADAIDRALARGDLIEDQLMYLGRYWTDQGKEGKVRACAIGLAAVGSGYPAYSTPRKRDLLTHLQAYSGASLDLLCSIEDQHINNVPAKQIAVNLRWSLKPWWKRMFRFAVPT